MDEMDEMYRRSRAAAMEAQNAAEPSLPLIGRFGFGQLDEAVAVRVDLGE
jgi:hypothetical protein